MDVQAYARTDLGPVRDNNEDALLVDTASGIFIVADGMGGHQHGEVASAIAVDVIHRVMKGGMQDPDETRLVRDEIPLDDSDEMRERLRYAMNQASVSIRQAAREEYVGSDMGTTAVVLVVEHEQVHVAHVGDSRAYLFRNGKMQRLTRDHTVVQQEVDAGRLTPELAKLVPHKNLLTQSVGFHGPVEPDTSTRMMLEGDIFVLCTDGVNDVLDDYVMADIAIRTPPDLLADTLVEESIASGATDNVTVVCVVVEG